MKKRPFLTAAIVALALLLVALLLTPFLRQAAEDRELRKLVQAVQQAELKAQAARLAPAPPPERSTLADALNSPTTDIRADLRLVSEIVDTFRSNLPREGNPVGTNAEITATLTGKNKLRLALIPPDHPAINREGELCDRWGTPFFFHAESANKMEVRSAGPDRKLWSEDDIVFTP